MDWTGEFYFGDCWMAYRGPAADNRLHAHAALQLCFAQESLAVLVTADGLSMSGRALLVRPGALHRLEAMGQVTLLLVEPQSPLGQTLLDASARDEIQPLDAGLTEALCLEGALENLVSNLRPSFEDAQTHIDPRLAAALDYLDRAPLQAAVSGAAKHCGLSESRLRALAGACLGVALSKWLVWRKMRTAALALAAGSSLADAAFAGGFADQAHFTRTMGKMIGITPTQARRALG